MAELTMMSKVVKSQTEKIFILTENWLENTFKLQNCKVIHD
jgi:hypothetical protein